MSLEGPLWAAILRAHARWSTSSAERFPPKIEWEPLSDPVGTGNLAQDQYVAEAVPAVPTVPTTREEVQAASPLTPDQEERAAILEFVAGLDRSAAERLARMSAAAD